MQNQAPFATKSMNHNAQHDPTCNRRNHNSPQQSKRASDRRRAHYLSLLSSPKRMPPPYALKSASR